VYACFGIFISCLPKVTQFYVTLGRRNFGGSSVRPVVPCGIHNRVLASRAKQIETGLYPLVAT
jgi:hypothetical protein